MSTKPGITPKCDRALELHEKGVDFDAISERLGVSRREVYALIKSAKARRSKTATGAAHA